MDLSLALLTLHPKSEDSRVSLGTQSCAHLPKTDVSYQNAFSALNVTKVEHTKAGKTKCSR